MHIEMTDLETPVIDSICGSCITSISGTPKRVGDEFCFNFWGEDCGNVALETRVLPWVEKAGMNHHFPLTTEKPLVVTLHEQHNMPT